MLHGNVKAVIKVIDSASNSGTPLRLDMPVDMNSPSWTVYNELLKKHPPGQPAHPEALKPLSSGGSDFHPVIFDAPDGTVIRSAALRTQGSAGPSGLDAYGWRRLCTSFQQASDDLCNSLALVAQCLCTTCVDPDGIDALVACCLIALDKCPGYAQLVLVKWYEELLQRLC